MDVSTGSGELFPPVPNDRIISYEGLAIYYKVLIYISFVLLLLGGCSGKSNAPTSSQSKAMSTPAAAAPANATGPFASKLAHGVIDQTRNAKEFRIRRSLWGVQSLIDDYQKHGYDTSRLEARKNKLEQQLKNLLG